MKLNLVPTHVAKERASGGAIFVMFVLILAGVFLAVIMMATSKTALDAQKKSEADALQRAADVKKISDMADTMMASPKTHAVVRNVSLAEAMRAHSDVYPNLYDKLRQYVPSYYRVTSMAASPGDADSCIVTMTGVLTTYQQYADLGLAFMRIPGAQSYSPSGYTITDQYVPNLTPEDMLGRPIRPNEGNVPSDPLQRLAYLQAQGTHSTYTGQGNFGDPDQTTKGAMPNASPVTITITLKTAPGGPNFGIQTPEPRATLSSAASAAATSTTTAGSPGAFGTPPSGAPPATTGGTTGGTPAAGG
ncbi:MAG TPA: hypothetical protein VKT78_02230 [Fimbriimonadaceae bacterium]|nr:hypothetical protein [Fimbriimonadaceae bacterium]